MRLFNTIILFAFIGLLAACQSMTKTIDKTPIKKEIVGMTSEEASQKFDLDIYPKLTYNGFYHYYLDADQKEVLQGAMELKSVEDMETYVSKNTPANPTEEDELFGAMMDYAQMAYKGQFVEGVKDGLFSLDAVYYEGEGFSTILFDAATKGCKEATYKGSAEGYCFEFKGPISICKFGEITNHTTEKECE